jgi:hypothetical protein
VTKCLCALALALSLTACAAGRSAVQGVATDGASRWVGTHGVEVAVPEPWHLNRGMCGTPKENTVLWNENSIPACLTGQPQGLSVVEFWGAFKRPPGWLRRHTTPVTIDGVRARRWDAGTVRGSHEVQLLFLHRNITVAVLSPDRFLLRRILASVRVVRTDQNGCPTHPAGAYTRGSRGSASKPFVPAEARHVVGCSYQGGWLDHSNRVGPTAARHLARAFDAAPFGFSLAPRGTILPSICGSTWRGSSITARFEYTGRRPVLVTAHLEGCTRLGASNGRWGIRVRPWWVGLLTSDARYYGAMVDPHNVR